MEKQDRAAQLLILISEIISKDMDTKINLEEVKTGTGQTVVEYPDSPLRFRGSPK